MPRPNLPNGSSVASRPTDIAAPDLTRRTLVLGATALPLLMLPGCGGTGVTTRLRVVNASLAYSAVDIYHDDDLLITALAAQSTSAWLELDSTRSAPLEVRRGGVLLVEAEWEPDTASDSTAIYSGNTDSPALLVEEDSDTDPGDNRCSLRAFNACDTASIDIYITTPGIPLTDAPPIFAGAEQGAYTEAAEAISGAQQLRITAAGDKGTIKLDVAITLPSNTAASLVVLPARSGVLVAAVLLASAADTVALSSAHARLRYVNALDVGTTMTPAFDDAAVTTAVKAPNATAYIQVASGEHPVGATIDGSTLSVTETLLPAQDHTWAVYGSDGARLTTLLLDDTRPAADTTKLRIRVVNLLAGVASVGLSIDLAPPAASAATGAASEYIEVTAGELRIDIVDAGQQVLATLEEQELDSGSVYTVFAMQGAGATGVVAQLRRDL
jgi:hypothetical protein